MKRIMFKKGFYTIALIYDEQKTMFRQIVNNINVKPKYALNEVIAVAMNYNCARIYWELLYKNQMLFKKDKYDKVCSLVNSDHPGRKNMAFTKTDLMPMHIKIKDFWLDHIQNITDEECMKSGILKDSFGDMLSNDVIYYYYDTEKIVDPKYFPTPKKAYADLFDEINGKGCWESNPLVYNYTFDVLELI